jgi:hypothetical protein
MVTKIRLPPSCKRSDCYGRGLIASLRSHELPNMTLHLTAELCSSTAESMRVNEAPKQ